MSRTPRLLPYLLGGVFALCACRNDPTDGFDPVGSLASSQISVRYDLAFWAAEQRAGTMVWLRGQTYCRKRSEKTYPNCAWIRLAGWIEAPPPPPQIVSPLLLNSDLAERKGLVP
ncbi:MAG TPA: hypothetical protein VN783_02990 [Thermoanaerobaculia bacterium]|nr:hypothetical protein [Thermoanaerobaculia bacterium]